MSIYGVQRKRPDEEVDPFRKLYDDSINQLPAPKEPVAATAVIPVGDTAVTVPVGPSAQFDDDPALRRLQESLDALYQAETAPVEKQSRLKAALKMGAAALSQVQGGNTWSDVARQVGAFGGGAASGVIQPKLPGAMQKMYNVQRREQDVERATKYANVASNITRRSAMTQQGEAGLKLRQDKQRLDEVWRRFQKDDKNRGRTFDEQKQAFHEYAVKRGLADRETMNEWRRDIGERRYELDRETFNWLKDIQGFNAEISAARLKAETDFKNMGKSEYDAKIEGMRAEAQANDAAADLIEKAVKENEALPALDRLEAGDLEKLRTAAREKRIKAQGLRAEVEKAPQGGVNVPVPKPPSGKRPKSDPLGLFP